MSVFIMFYGIQRNPPWLISNAHTGAIWDTISANYSPCSKSGLPIRHCFRIWMHTSPYGSKILSSINKASYGKKLFFPIIKRRYKSRRRSDWDFFCIDYFIESLGMAKYLQGSSHHLKAVDFRLWQTKGFNL